MTLNIKDKAAHELARALADETGQSMTQAVIAALRQGLATARKKKRARATAEELMAIARRCAANLKGKPVDHDRLLYDKHGLPK